MTKKKTKKNGIFFEKKRRKGKKKQTWQQRRERAGGAVNFWICWIFVLRPVNFYEADFARHDAPSPIAHFSLGRFRYARSSNSVAPSNSSQDHSVQPSATRWKASKTQSDSVKLGKTQ